LLDRIPAIFRSPRSALRGAPKLSLLFLCISLIIAVLPVSWITPYDSIEISPADLLKAPEFSGHILGTDNQGRDVLSRLIHGGQSSVRVAVVAVILAAILGTVVALTAGVFRGWVDRLLMQITDAFLSLPYLMVALTVVTLLGPSIINLIIVIGFLRWMGFARVLRGEVLRLMEMDFVRLANVAGSSRPRIMLRHVFPNIINTLLVLATLEVGLAVIVEASLSFLGLGVQRPIPSWGNMLRDAQQFLFFPGAWWFPLIPGIAITFLVMSCNLTGDWLRDRTDPTRRQL
jgi:peptide/nickel transport system permease protein